MAINYKANKDTNEYLKSQNPVVPLEIGYLVKSGTIVKVESSDMVKIGNSTANYLLKYSEPNNAVGGSATYYLSDDLDKYDEYSNNKIIYISAISLLFIVGLAYYLYQKKSK